MASPSARGAHEVSTSATHSGKLLLRMPPSLHARLAQEAERRGVSLNQLITTRLEQSLTRSGGDRVARGGAASTGPESAAPPSNGALRLTSLALGINVVVVVIAGLVAIALLVVALADLY